MLGDPKTPDFFHFPSPHLTHPFLLSALYHSPGGQKSERQVSAGLVLREAPRENLVPASLASGGGGRPQKPWAWSQVAQSLHPPLLCHLRGLSCFLPGHLPLDGGPPRIQMISCGGSSLHCICKDSCPRSRHLWSFLGDTSLGAPSASPAPLCHLLPAEKS